MGGLRMHIRNSESQRIIEQLSPFLMPRYSAVGVKECSSPIEACIREPAGRVALGLRADTSPTNSFSTDHSRRAGLRKSHSVTGKCLSLRALESRQDVWLSYFIL